MNIGDIAPAFELPATDGGRHYGPDGVTAVVFTCNHCPYAIAWHDRLLEVARDYEGRAGVLFVNPNDAERYPRDSFDAMKERVEADGGWPAPYLRDESQEVARAFGAEDHPGRLRPRRRAARCATAARRTRDYEDPGAGAAWLRAALDAVLAGREPEPAETEPVGCSVKWSQ